MRRIFPLFLFASLALAADPQFLNIQLSSDAKQRYTINGLMASIRIPCLPHPLPNLTSPVQLHPPILQFCPYDKHPVRERRHLRLQRLWQCHFVSRSRPITADPCPDQSTHLLILRYNQQGSASYQSLSTSGDVNLVGGASASGPLIKEFCSLRAKNGTAWPYPNQTSA